MLKTITGGVLILIACSTSFSQPVDTVTQMDRLFAAWNNDTPGGAVLVTRGDKILYNKAFGLADLEHDVPNRTTTIFESGSVSKQFTATAALLLVREGKLALEDDVRKYIPELPAYGAPVRVRHLLTHTSGLKDWGSVGSISGWPRTTRVYTNELALQIICRQKSLNFAPGAEYSYSNSNYTLLVVLVERISKQTLADFTSERLFKPAGMLNTKWRSNFREVLPNRAISYGRRDGMFEQVMPFENVHGHGGLLTTTADLNKWNNQLLTRDIGGNELYALRVKQGKLNNGTDISYASGIVVQKYGALTEISHSGATAGYRAYLVLYPEKKLSVAILSNDGTFNAPGAGNAIARIFLGDRPENPKPKTPQAVQLSDQRLQQWSGTYRSIRQFDVLDITLDGKELKSGGKILVAGHNDTLYADGATWISRAGGKVMLKRGTDTSSYIKVKPADVTAKSQQALVGTYESEEADCFYAVEVRENKLYLVNAPFPPIELAPKFLDGFQLDGEDLVQFNRNAKGVVTGFELSVSRAERITFMRVKP
jgi:CubicO group peptidase (beta-lactamase class C family)